MYLELLKRSLISFLKAFALDRAKAGKTIAQIRNEFVALIERELADMDQDQDGVPDISE